jgi:membrane protein DedA with SNARE-associated domain
MTDTFPWPIQNVAEWMPFWKAAGFFLATFVLEDAAVIGAGLLLAVGQISWPVAFVSCFLGIWLGDAGLYSLARFGRRKWFEKLSLEKYAAGVARSEVWFAERGNWILVFSRCVPGSRLPTYLSAGFLRVPLLQFLAITGVAALAWALFILWLVQALGVQVSHWLKVWKHGSLILIGVGGALIGLLQLARVKLAHFDLQAAGAKIERWRHWEFWPGWLFYPPVFLNYLRLSAKYRGFALPTAANPGIFSGGIVGESKFAILSELTRTSPEFTADTALIVGKSFEKRLISLQESRVRLKLEFPFVLKPDIGQRGVGVKLIRDLVQAENYLRGFSIPVVVQKYAPGPCEVGIFYYRFPYEARGKIFGIVEKIFPVVTGDGRSSVAELVSRDSRARLIADTYARRLGSRWNEVLPPGDTLKLVEAGNHAQGCIFRDGAHLFSPDLEGRIDEISRRLVGFFIGRYDIRFSSSDDLRAGKNFQIVELNGAASESGNLYDARNSLWTAYRTLFQQWELVFQIGTENRKRGVKPASLQVVWQQWREFKKNSAGYPVAD